MDKELFKQKLSEVAEWRQPEITKSDLKIARQRARGRRSREDQYQEEHEQVFIEMFQGHNPTMPAELVKVKQCLKECDHCGLMVEGGEHIEKKLYLTGPRRHWRERCLTCSKSRDPYTGRFDLTGTEASIKWNSYLRNNRQGEDKLSEIHTDDNCVITFYGRSTEENK